MDIWKVLGIEPTKDKKVIAEAYRNKLVDTNPEDKSEEFKELRNAYEQALLECEKVIKTNKSKVELWYDKLVDLYNNFPERIKVNNWKELLSENVCFSIDSKMQVEEKLITFLMDYYFISHDTWKCIDERFDLLNRTEELYQSYPRDFIDYIVINGIMYDDYLQFDLFEPGESEEEFNETVATAKKCFNMIHVFPFSAREGTGAYLMKDQIDPQTKAKRTEVLINLSKVLWEEYQNKFIGKELKVLVERFDSKNKVNIGHTSNYLEVKVPSNESKVGKYISVTITKDLIVYK